LEIGMTVDLVGYGSTSVVGGATSLKNTARAVIEGSDEVELVIGKAAEVESCGGDSGGPAFAGRGTGRRLVALTSRAFDPQLPCSGGTILTRLSGERAFIEESLR